MDRPAHLLIRSPEITLKKKNQGDFWTRLRINVRHWLRLRGLDWPIRNERAGIRVETDTGLDEGARVARALARLPGVDSIAVALRLERNELLKGGVVDRGRLENTLVELARDYYRPGKAFALRPHRVDKKFPLSTAELAEWLGNAIRQRTPWETVKLDSPDRTFHLDIYKRGVFVYAERVKGTGGLPVGSSGRVLSLLSGGIDSPVASYLVARRGCSVDWFHMSATHVSEGDFEGSVVGRIARQLSSFTLRSRLFVVPYTHFDLAMSGQDTGYEPVLFRRFLFRVAERLAEEIGAVALVTGDSLAQVASQTIENLIASTKAVDSLVLRPLVGMDKQDIMAEARRIGTYETSIEPYKDCCALFSKRVKTKTYDGALAGLESRLLPRYEELVTGSLGDLKWAEYDCGELVSVHETRDELENAAERTRRIRLETART